MVKKKRTAPPPDDNICVGQFFDPQDDPLTVDEFEALLQIDKDALDEAIVEQPDAFWRVAHKLALQISRRDAAKQYLANQSAQVDGQLRRAAANSETKMTVQEIEARTLVSANVVKATDQLLRMDHSVREWQALKEAIVARGFALRDLVALYINEHYQTSSISGSSTMKDIEAQRTREAMNQLRKARR